jgi:hypothetical protein
MKTVAFAATTQWVLPSGQLDLTIQHETIRGVIPAMRRWWFETLGQAINSASATCSAHSPKVRAIIREWLLYLARCAV